MIDAETDPTANVQSDHIPLITVLHMQHTRQHKKPTEKLDFDVCNKAQHNTYNMVLACTLQPSDWSTRDIQKKMQLVAQDEFPIHYNAQERNYLSPYSQNLITQLRHERAQPYPNYDLIQRLHKDLRKHVDKDKKAMQLRNVDHQLDIRDKWMGIKAMKRTYNPLPYSRKNSAGKIVPLAERPEASAKYLAEVQWKRPPLPPLTYTNMYYEPPDHYYIWGELNIYDLMEAIRRLKRHKTPGPDGIKAEIFKELEDENIEKLLPLFIQWWNNPETITSSDTLAQIALIYKNKGDSSLCENYRPISLLNTFYKIFASMVQNRIARGAESNMHKTQYGFRRHKGTHQALHSVRKVVTHGEMHQERFYCCSTRLGKSV